MRTSFASLEPETPQYLHLFRECADRWALLCPARGLYPRSDLAPEGREMATVGEGVEC